MNKTATRILKLIICFSPFLASGQRPLLGVYDCGDSSFAAFGLMEDKPFVTFSGGDIRGIRTGTSSKTFEIGNALGLFNAVEGRVVKVDGRTMEIFRGDQPKKVCKLVDFSMQEKRFKNGGTKLSGTLILPPGPGPFPCVVLTQGSGSEHREASYGLAFLFAGNGIAAFAYDKRFVDDKDEDRWQDSFDNYAGDAIAAASMLKIQREIDSKKIGIYGHSQGGWVAPLAASKSDLFSFAIISAGNVVSPVEQHLYNGSCTLRQNGVKESVIQEIYEFREIKYEAGIKGIRHRYDSALPIAQKRSWFVRTGGDLPTSRFWKANGYYDSKPALMSLRIPVLVIAGDLDKYTDTKRNMDLFQNIFRESRHADVTYKTFPSANHALMETSTGKLDETEMTELKKFAAGYPDLLPAWVRKKTK